MLLKSFLLIYYYVAKSTPDFHIGRQKVYSLPKARVDIKKLPFLVTPFNLKLMNIYHVNKNGETTCICIISFARSKKRGQGLDSPNEDSDLEP